MKKYKYYVKHEEKGLKNISDISKLAGITLYKCWFLVYGKKIPAPNILFRKKYYYAEADVPKVLMAIGKILK